MEIITRLADRERKLVIWIFAFVSVVVFLVILGGYVRLTRSGLSIVEWNPVYGVLLPIRDQAWEQEFAKYKTSPEFLKVNFAITLDEFKEIYFLEWIHRLIARVAGLVFAIPFFIFLSKKTIRVKEIKPYFIIGLLFLIQAVMGWIMVSSGLKDRPAVSHIALAAHLIFAFMLIGLSFWTALDLLFLRQGSKSSWTVAGKSFLSVVLVLVFEIIYGAFTAGLKAGHVSNTWPLMYGKIIPPGLLSQYQSPLLNFLESPLTVMFVHRWLAFIFLVAVGAFFWNTRKMRFSAEVGLGLKLLLMFTVVQILLGILVVLLNVHIALALAHQANAIALFATAVFCLHRLKEEKIPE